MRIMRFTILPLLTLLMVTFAIPAAASCSVCIPTITVNEDGSSQQTGAQCELSPQGDITDCKVIGIRNPECASMALVASCGDPNNTYCPPWDWRCPPIQYVKARRMQSMVRPILSAM